MSDPTTFVLLASILQPLEDGADAKGEALRYRVKASVAERVAAQQAPAGEQDPP